MDQATEWYVHCKTTSFRLPQLMTRLHVLHPYDVPEILAMPIVHGHQPYLRWVEEMVQPLG